MIKCPQFVKRSLILLSLWVLSATALSAEALADLSSLEGKWRLRGADLVLSLSDPVAWRAHVEEEGRVLVLAWEGQITGAPGLLPERRFGLIEHRFEDGWTELRVALARRMVIASAALESENPARLQLRLRRANAADASALSLDGEIAATEVETETATARSRLVVIDPGHGGHDPGAVRQGLQEKDIALDIALRLNEALRARGIDTVLTREDDSFISLDQRVALARGANAGLLVSIHADAFEDSSISGSSVYTLSQASVPPDRADDFVGGVAPEGSDLELEELLIGLAQRGSLRDANRVRHDILRGFEQAGIALNRSPVRNAGFRVLQAPDVPSVLIEFGYMSNPNDRARLADPNWRARAAQTVAQAIAGPETNQP